LSDVLLRDLTERIKEQAVIKKVGSGCFEGNIYLVGGAIREIALGSSPRDYDFIIDQEKDLKVFEVLFGASSFVLGKKPIHTHRIIVGTLSLDINSFEGTVEDDCRRRDFTVNAIAYDLKRDMIVDPLGGLTDLARRTIRCPRSQVLLDDPLRMLKAVRHYATLENFSLDPELIAAVTVLKGHIHESAPERIKSEFDQIITSPMPHEGIKMLEETGLLFEFIPDLEALRKMDEEKGFALGTYRHMVEGFRYLKKYGALYGLPEKDLKSVGYAFLFHDLGKAVTFSYDPEKEAVHFFYHEKYSCNMAERVMEGLRFSAHEIKAVLTLIEHHMRVFLISGSESTERAVRRLVYKMGELTPLLLVHTMCDMYGSSGGSENESTARVESRCKDVLHMYFDWKREPLPVLVSGRDLLSLGFRAGPLVGMILADIRERQISGEIRDKGEALEYAESFLSPGTQ
jgi:poly(A) polymerase